MSRRGRTEPKRLDSSMLSIRLPRCNPLGSLSAPELRISLSPLPPAATSVRGPQCDVGVGNETVASEPRSTLILKVDNSSTSSLPATLHYGRDRAAVSFPALPWSKAHRSLGKVMARADIQPWRELPMCREPTFRPDSEKCHRRVRPLERRGVRCDTLRRLCGTRRTLVNLENRGSSRNTALRFWS